MLLIAVAMLSILALCAGVVLYVAFPHRGQQMPVAPWVGDAMGRAARSLPRHLEPQDFYEPADDRLSA